MRLHVWHWSGNGSRPDARPLIALHGWMDLGASFQFLVDELPDHVTVYAPDWRGFGRSANSGVDSYWFYDYLGDLDRLLAELLQDRPIDLLGHSMGGNVAMIYAGVRPSRVVNLVNLEGAGLPPSNPARAPVRLGEWLDELAKPRRMSRYPSFEAVATRLMKGNPRLREDRAQWLARQCAARTGEGDYAWRADPQHKQINPYLYRAEEVDACWQAIAAPVLWVDSEYPNDWHRFTTEPEFLVRRARIADLTHHVLPGTGHMLHHDQPEALARLVSEFLAHDS